jgi:UDP-glucose 4-epimerase
LEGIHVAVTGGCGFIGSHLVDQLLGYGSLVLVIDNLSTGTITNLRSHLADRHLKIENINITDQKTLIASIKKDIDCVFHFAANPDVRGSGIAPEIHFSSNIQGTYNLLEAMRINDVRQLVFASSSSVYGETGSTAAKESSALCPVSVYGATKLSCEALVRAYSSTYGLAAVCLRYGNIIGPRLGHGIVYDFFVKLRRNPTELEILGNGTQSRTYLHVTDTVDATFRVLPKKGLDVFNVGNVDAVKVDEVASIVSAVLGLRDVKIKHRPIAAGVGWIGDVRQAILDSSRLVGLGWKPTLSSREAIAFTTDSLVKQTTVG